MKLTVRVSRTLLLPSQREYLRSSIWERGKSFKDLRKPAEARRVYEYRIRKRLDRLPELLANLFQDIFLVFNFLLQEDRLKEFDEVSKKIREKFRGRGVSPLGLVRLCFNMSEVFAEYFEDLPSDSIRDLILRVKEKMLIGDVLRVAGSYNMLVEQVNKDIERLKMDHPERVVMEPEVKVMYDLSEDLIKEELNGTKHFVEREKWIPLYYLRPMDFTAEGDLFTGLKRRLVEYERSRQLDRLADELHLEGISQNLWISGLGWLEDRKRHLEIFRFIAENIEKPEAAVSRDAIEEETGLNRRRVTRICNQLIREKLITEPNTGRYELTKYGKFQVIAWGSRLLRM